MAGKIDETHRDKYNSDEVDMYAANTENDPINQAFLFPALKEYLSSEAGGKKVLDIGCGTGIWTKYASECGAGSVDGFDISTDMVGLSKQATAHLSNVNISIGDAANMPYEDNTFNTAMYISVTNALSLETFTKSFMELSRVLVPGGKAVVWHRAKAAYDRMILDAGTNQAALEEKIQSILAKFSKQPTNEQVNTALNEIVRATFALDEEGRLYKVTNLSQLVNGHAVYTLTTIMVFPDYYYTDEFIQDQIKAAGLHLDRIECFCTEERRVAYNNSKQKFKLDKGVTDHPPHYLYHVSKPVK